MVRQRGCALVLFDPFYKVNTPSTKFFIVETDFNSVTAAYKQEAYCKHKGKCLHKKIEMQTIIHDLINFLMNL